VFTAVFRLPFDPTRAAAGACAAGACIEVEVAEGEVDTTEVAGNSSIAKFTTQLKTLVIMSIK